MLGAARRKFDEALKVLPPSQDKTETVAQQGLQYCNKLFAIERELKDSTPEKRYTIRQEQIALFWMLICYGCASMIRMLPKSKLGEAIGYNLNQWEKADGFLRGR